jgi:hypothetical protein
VNEIQDPLAEIGASIDRLDDDIVDRPAERNVSRGRPVG